jgi:transcriptional regulator with XRE-family HTH domain
MSRCAQPKLPYDVWAEWIREQLSRETHGDQRTLARRMGVSDRRVYDWKHQLREIERQAVVGSWLSLMPIEDALRRLDISIEDVFGAHWDSGPHEGCECTGCTDPEWRDPPLVTGFCPTCAEEVLCSRHARCLWCGTRVPGAVVRTPVVCT